MGAENCLKRFCQRPETKSRRRNVSARLESKLESKFEPKSITHFSDILPNKTKYVRRFDFDSDLKFLSNFPDLKENNSIQPEENKILQLKRIRRFDFSPISKPNYQKEGYDLMVKLYGENLAKEFSNSNFSQQSVEQLKELLESLNKIPSTVSQWNQASSTVNRVEEIKKLNIPKELQFDEPELDDKVISNLVEQLNNLDMNEFRDGSYIYPYGDEPIYNEDANLTIQNWFKQLSNEHLNVIEKQIHMICYLVKIIMNTWKPAPWTKIIYGYYMARDLYRIFTSLNIEHLRILDLIQSTLGITFDWNEFNYESMKLDENINYINIINIAATKIERNDPKIFEFIRKEVNLVTDKIDSWIVKMGQI